MNTKDMFCPFRPYKIIYHNDKNNINLPKAGINRIIDYDLETTLFDSCFREKCMMYDTFSESCQLAKNNSFNI